MRFSRVEEWRHRRTHTTSSGIYQRFYRLEPRLSCDILLTREAVNPLQTEQKYLAAVPDLGNIAELSVPLIAEEYWVRPVCVGLVSCAGPIRRQATTPLSSQPQLLAWHGHSLAGAHAVPSVVQPTGGP
jgi:hypothetical protein